MARGNKTNNAHPRGPLSTKEILAQLADVGFHITRQKGHKPGTEVLHLIKNANPDKKTPRASLVFHTKSGFVEKRELRQTLRSAGLPLQDFGL